MCSRCVYWGKIERTNERLQRCSLVTYIRTHVDEFGDSIIFPMGWNSGFLALRFALSFTNNSICVSVLHSTFVPGKNGDDQLRVLETWSSAQMLSTMIYGLMHKQGCTSIFMRWIIRLFLCFIIKEMNNFMQQIWQTSRARKMCQNLQYKINILFRIISCTFIKTNLIV